MLIDANILPTEEIDQENLDIISPAFKIIWQSIKINWMIQLIAFHFFEFF